MVFQRIGCGLIGVVYDRCTVGEEPSVSVRNRVKEARDVQCERFADETFTATPIWAAGCSNNTAA